MTGWRSTSGDNSSHKDVYIIGAGLSGIAAAYHLQDQCPRLSYGILEGRKTTGGTWDLFQYPGIRSDSDMYTLGFSFYPWKNPKAIADGPAIHQYIRETSDHFGITDHIQFESKVISANWDNSKNVWSLQVRRSQGKTELVTCKFLFGCCGYYDYEQGYMPDYLGQDRYEGKLIHPQHWDTSLDYTDKKVVVIGSGATAVTLVPELAKKAKIVTMLQRSPTYILSVPSEDPIVNIAKKILPEKKVYAFARWKNIRTSIFIYWFARKYPKTCKKYLMKAIKKKLGKDYDMSHFDPKYNPWDQRLCLIPDDDLFNSIKHGKAQVVTDQISTFTPSGIQLMSGKEIDADIVVSATGLNIRLFGGISLSIEGQQIDMSSQFIYRGTMVSDVPNFAFAIGYTNASWTLKCDLSAQYIAKLLKHMSETNQEVVTPRFDSNKYAARPLLDFDAGYVKRAQDVLPKQGSAEPWLVHQHYLKDRKTIGSARLEDGHLEYRG